MDELKLAMLASQMAKHAREKKAAQKKIKALTDKGDAIGAANIHLVAAVADFNKEQAARWIENSVRSDGKYLQNWIFVPSPMLDERIFSAFHPCSSTDFTHTTFETSWTHYGDEEVNLPDPAACMHVKDGGVLGVRILQNAARNAALAVCTWEALTETKKGWKRIDEATKVYIPGFDSPTRRQVDIRSSEYFNTCVQLNNVP